MSAFTEMSSSVNRVSDQQLRTVYTLGGRRDRVFKKERAVHHLRTAASPKTDTEEAGETKETTSKQKALDLQAGILDPEPPSPWLQAKSNVPSAAELTVFLVAAFWGTNPVCLRYTYLLEKAPSPAALAAIQSAGAALLLTAASYLKLSSAQGTAAAAVAAEGETHREEEGESPSRGQNFLDELFHPVARAGLETGAWTFLANSATISAFQHTPASRGAFLIRLTAVFTPAVAKLSGQYVSKSEWTACGMALAGGLLISLDSLLATPDSSAKDATLGSGDAVMVISACLWAVQTVRVGYHAKQHDQLELARSQTVTFALLSAVWLAGLTLWEGPHHDTTGSLFSGSTSPLVWSAVLWPAIGPWGIATALQLRAQRVVSASKTQIILATDPLWASLFARVLGSAEQSLGLVGWAGAAGILAASAVARH